MSKSPNELWARETSGYKAYARCNPVNGTWTCFAIDQTRYKENEVLGSGLTYPEVKSLLEKIGHLVRRDAKVNLKKESEKYKQLSFGQFILGIAADADMSRNELLSRALSSKENLEMIPSKLYEMWLDSTAAKGSNPSYWTQDTEREFWSIINDADKLIRALDEIPNDDDLLEMFNSAVLNLAYGVVANKSSKAFIQKSIGIGFLGRVFS